MDQICEVMIAVLRSVCKKSFFNIQSRKNAINKTSTNFVRKLLISRPTTILYEQFVMTYYLQVCNFIQLQMNKVSTLEQDLEMLKRGEPGHPGQPLEFRVRMAVVYRSEKKKILRSQINLIQKVQHVLNNCENIM